MFLTRPGDEYLASNPKRPPRRTPFIDIVDKGLRAGRRLGAIAPVRLEAGHLKEQAILQADGLADFGDPWFEQPLAVLLDSIRDEGRLNAAGDLSAMLQFRQVLFHRLLSEYWFKRHPEILERPMRSPVVIVGPMRSGTTRLHRRSATDLGAMPASVGPV